VTVLLITEAPPPARDVLVFGSGAIGGAVVRALRRRGAYSPVPCAVPWDDPVATRGFLDDLTIRLTDRAGSRAISVVWAAGRTGFGSSDEQAAAEMHTFTDVVHLVARLRGKAPSHQHALHLVSSAGGLYEGRSIRSPGDPPAPLRPYGRLKLAQEQHATAELSEEGVAIYRPSSVYTAPGRGRLGLIGALVSNGIAQAQTTITGALDTLRDYVLADDIGAFIADHSTAGVDAQDNRHMLVSGDPASIRHVMTTVESVIRRRLYVRVAEAWNAQNITFSPVVRARRFRPTPLFVGIGMVHRASLGRPVAA